MVFRLPASDSTISIINCDFQNSEAARTFDGGALYFYLNKYPNENISNSVPSKLLIDKSRFVNNIAGQGGSIFQASMDEVVAELVVQDTTFFCCNGSFAKNYAYNSTIFISSIKTKLVNVNFLDQPHNTFCAIPGLILQNESQLDGVAYECKETRVLTYIAPMKHNTHSDSSENISISDAEYFSTFMLICQECTFLPDTIGDGVIEIYNGSLGKVQPTTDVQCKRKKN